MKKIYSLCVFLVLVGNNGFASTNNSMRRSSSEPHLRIQLQKDSINTDDTYIGFEPNADPAYVVNSDAKYFQGWGAVSMASVSTDNVKLAINRLSLPNSSETVRLYVYTATSGTYLLNVTEDEGIPPLYSIWLKDNYKKDSLNISVNSTYSFTTLKSDTNSYGTGRFSLVIRANQSLTFSLIDFSAVKSGGVVQVAWDTKNESNSTHFEVQRSSDNGLSFNRIDTLTSNSTGNYRYADETPLHSAAEYRLQITDLNGGITYSGTITLDGTTSSTPLSAMSLYPNPTSGRINVAIQPGLPAAALNTTLATDGIARMNILAVPQRASYRIQVVSITGAVVKSTTSSSPDWEMDMSGYSSGTYVIQVTSADNNNVVWKSTFVKM